MQCRIVLKKNDYTLVEWEKTRRAWIPTVAAVKIDGTDMVEVENPEEGIPYGIDFSAVEAPKFDMQEIDEMLKTRGIWTAEDVAEKPQQVVNVLQAVLGISYANFVNLIKENQE